MSNTPGQKISRYQIFALLAIIVLGSIIRLVHLEHNPPGFFSDESAIAVNASLIEQKGIDQYGNHYPVFFRALDDYKAPIYIYSTALLYSFTEVNETSTRLPAAIFGILAILITFFLARETLGSNWGSILASLFLCISPWHIQYSRMAWQAITMTVFYPLALLFFFRWIKQKSWQSAILCGFFLAMTLYTYTIAKMLVPVTLLLMLLFQIFHKLQLSKSQIALFAVIFTISSLPFVIGYIQFASFVNLRLHRLMLPWYIMPFAYFSYFSPEFLFFKGDANLRHSAGGVLHLYMAPLIIFGVYYFIKAQCSFKRFIVIVFFFIPCLGAITWSYPHATRTIVFLPVVQIIAAGGGMYIATFIHKLRIKKYIAIFFILWIVFSSVSHLHYYFFEYKQIVKPHWSKDLMPALREASYISTDETVYLYGIPYIDWMFIEPVSPQTILKHKESLQRFQSSYDPGDKKRKYSFLRCYVYKAKPQLNIHRGLWVIPNKYLPDLQNKVIFQNEFYSVVRIE